MTTIIGVAVFVVAILILLMALYFGVYPKFRRTNSLHMVNPIVRGRPIFIYYNNKSGEVVDGHMHGTGISIGIQEPSGQYCTTDPIEEYDIVPVNGHQALISDFAPQYTMRSIKYALQGKTELATMAHQLEESKKKIMELESKCVELKAEMEHRVKERVDQQIELNKSKPKPFGGMVGGR